MSPHFRSVTFGLVAICFFLITLAGAAHLFPFQDLFFMTIFMFGVCALLTYVDK